MHFNSKSVGSVLNIWGRGPCEILKAPPGKTPQRLELWARQRGGRSSQAQRGKGPSPLAAPARLSLQVALSGAERAVVTHGKAGLEKRGLLIGYDQSRFLFVFPAFWGGDPGTILGQGEEVYVLRGRRPGKDLAHLTDGGKKYKTCVAHRLAQAQS